MDLCRWASVATLVATLAVCVVGAAAPPSARDLFRVEVLPVDLRPDFEALRLRTSEQEALFTLADGQKPMSSGFWSGSLPVDATAIPEVGRARTLSEAISADVLVPARAWNGRRNAEAFVVRKSGMKDAILREPGFLVPLGVTANTHPAVVVAAVEHAPRAPRHRGYDDLYGYPKHAVGFFVQAGDDQERTGRFVERHFANLPTFSAARGRSVYAVPKGQVPNSGDGGGRARSRRALVDYMVRRRRAIGEGRPRIVGLWRSWLTETGVAAPHDAKSAAGL